MNILTTQSFREWLDNPLTKALKQSHKQAVKDIINTLMINHEAALGKHNYYLVAANLIEAEFGEKDSEI